MSEGDGRPTAAKAQATADKAAAEIKSHEEVCAVRYTQIAADISSIKGLLRWIGMTGVVAMLGLATWGVEQWIVGGRAEHALDTAQRESQRQQIQFLQTQLQQLSGQIKPGQPVVVNNTPPMLPAPPAGVDATP